jgi:hypothetical protein
MKLTCEHVLIQFQTCQNMSKLVQNYKMMKSFYKHVQTYHNAYDVI